VSSSRGPVAVSFTQFGVDLRWARVDLSATDTSSCSCEASAMVLLLSCNFHAVRWRLSPRLDVGIRRRPAEMAMQWTRW
jgi:hypothetical protein